MRERERERNRECVYVCVCVCVRVCVRYDWLMRASGRACSACVTDPVRKKRK